MIEDSLCAKSDDLAQELGVAAPVPPSGPFFEQTDWLSFGATTLLTLTIYVLTLSPEVGLWNQGIFSTGANYAGTQMPPGYPLWTLWAWTFIKLLPIANVAWRTAFSTAVAGALACGLIALMVSRGGAPIMDQSARRQQLKPKEEKWLRAVCGYSAGMVFGLNGAFWPRAVVADPWTLSILILCVVLCLFMRWIYGPGNKRCLCAAAFCYGLLLTNSQIELAFAPAIPFLVLLGNQKLGRDLFLLGGILFVTGLVGIHFGIFPSLRGCDGQFFLFNMFGVVGSMVGIALAIQTRQLFSEWKAVLVCGAMFLLGLSLYLYLPIASMTNPPVNWGYPRTVEGFFHEITRGQYERMYPTDNAALFLKQISMYFAMAGKEFGWPYLLLSAAPFYFLRRVAALEFRWLLGSLVVFGCLAFLMLAVLNPSKDRQSQELLKFFFSASYVVVSLWMGRGLITLATLLVKSQNSKSASAQ